MSRISSSSIESSISDIKMSHFISNEYNNVQNNSPLQNNIINAYPNKFKEYILLKEIGRGGYGTIFLCEEEDSGKQYAIKIMDKLFLSQNGRAKEALMERLCLSLCNHPSIIKLIKSFQTSEKFCLVLEFFENGDLETLLEEILFIPRNVVLQYAAEIINILEYLHEELHMSHNDLKPSNFMLDIKYHLKLIDFNTAKIIDKKLDINTNQLVDINDNLLTNNNSNNIMNYTNDLYKENSNINDKNIYRIRKETENYDINTNANTNIYSNNNVDNEDYYEFSNINSINEKNNINNNNNDDSISTNININNILNNINNNKNKNYYNEKNDNTITNTIHNINTDDNINIDNHINTNISINTNTFNSKSKKNSICSKKSLSNKNNKSNIYSSISLIGTIEYMSPEILCGKKNDLRKNDIWSFGIILYYFLTGKRPFVGDNEEEIKKKILNFDINFNEIYGDDKDLIKKLLEPDPGKRPTISQIKRHPFFTKEKINFKKILEKDLPFNKEKLQLLMNEYNKENRITMLQNDFYIKKYKKFPFIFIENFYYSKEESPIRFLKALSDLTSRRTKKSSRKNTTPSMIYEGILLNIRTFSFLNKEVRFRLFNNGNLEVWDLKENTLSKIILIKKNLDISVNNDIFLVIEDKKYKTSKIEAIKWYNYINQVIIIQNG